MDFEKEITSFLNFTPDNTSSEVTKVFKQTIQFGDSKYLIKCIIRMKSYMHMKGLAELTFSFEPVNFLVDINETVMHTKNMALVSFTTKNLAHIPFNDLNYELAKATFDAIDKFIKTSLNLLNLIDSRIEEEEFEANEIEKEIDALREENAHGEIIVSKICIQNINNINIKILKEQKEKINEYLKMIRSSNLKLLSEER